MKRKIIKQGHDTLTITLPKKWTEKNNVNAGDELELKDSEGKLVLFSGPDDVKKKYSVNIDRYESVGKRIITSAYRSGYDEIDIGFKKKSYNSTIQKRLNEQMIGFEITKKSSDSCLIKDFSGGEDQEFQTSSRRCWLILLELSEETYKSIMDKDFESLKHMYLKNGSLHKFTNYSVRLSLKIKRDSTSDVALFFHFIRNLREIADEYLGLASYISKTKTVLADETKEVLKANNKHLKKFYELYYKFDMKGMERLLKETKDTFNHIEEMSVQKKYNTMGIHYVFSISQRIRKLLSTVIQMNL